MPDPISLTWDNNDGSYYIVVIENMETTLIPIRDFGDNDTSGKHVSETTHNSIRA